MGGERRRGRVVFVSGYSSRAQCIGNPAAYLAPNRNSLQKPKRGRSVLEFSAAISALKNSTVAFESIYKGGGRYLRVLALSKLAINPPLNKRAIDKKSTSVAGKVYFIAWYYDVKLQADNHVRWDVAERLNRKQIKHGGEK